MAEVLRGESLGAAESEWAILVVKLGSANSKKVNAQLAGPGTCVRVRASVPFWGFDVCTHSIMHPGVQDTNMIGDPRGVVIKHASSLYCLEKVCRIGWSSSAKHLPQESPLRVKSHFGWPLM